MRNRTIQIFTLIAMIVVGGLIGAGVTLLVAPHSGEETRHMLRRRSVKLKNKALESASDTRERASKVLNDMAKQTKNRVSSISKRSQEMVDEGKRRIGETMHMG